MTLLKLKNLLTNEVFDREYDNCFECRKFLLKLQFSKKLKCIRITTSSYAELEVYRNIRIGY